MKNHTKNLLVLFVSILFLCSCGVSKENSLFVAPTDYRTDTISRVYVVNNRSGNELYRVRPADRLVIKNLQEKDYDGRVVSNANGTVATTIQNTQSYQVDEYGFVKIPSVEEKIKVGGLTRREVTEKIQFVFEKIIGVKDPIVEVTIINLKVTVLGEFAKQGNYLLERDNITLIDIIGEAGGLTKEADRKSLKIIRGDRSNPEIIYVNLNDVNSLASKKLLLQNDDIITITQQNSYASATRLQNLNNFLQPFLIILNLGLLIYTITKYMNVLENTGQSKLLSQTISYWKIIRILISRWYWIAGTVLIGFIAAKIYLKYTPPIYYTEATLKLESPDQQSAIGQLNTPASRFTRPNQIQSEGLIMKSPDVIIKAIERLPYRISYFLKGRAITSQVYPNIPFVINIIQQDKENFSRENYEVRAINNNSFSIYPASNPKNKATYRYGDQISLGRMLFSIESSIPIGAKYSFKFNSATDLYQLTVAGLNVDEQEKNTNIMKVSHTSGNAKFSADILNAIIKQYVLNDTEQKKRSAIQTIEFLEGQESSLDTAVRKSGDDLANFQTQSNIIDPEIDKQLYTGRLTDYQTQLDQLKLQEGNIRLLENQLRSNKDQTPLDLNFEGTGSNQLTLPISQYNLVVNERIEKLNSFVPGSKPILELDKKLADLKSAISNGIAEIRLKNQRATQFLSKNLGNVNSTIKSIPKKQNLFSRLGIKNSINQETYSKLFERRLSAEITRAAIVPGATILSYAELGSKISPKERQIYVSYMFMGLLAGLGIIILIRLLNPYIYDVETVEGLTIIPIIGVILKYPEVILSDMKKILSLDKPKSIFAESVRSVRTNLSFMASQKATKVICVTSEISGEGKSFVTVNLAGTLAIIDKKVIVIAADLRRSKLHRTFGSDNKIGLSTYLAAINTVDEIIFHDELHHIDYITSGPVPPNPSELLHNPRMENLISLLKHTYEYIIIDTAPVGLVSDSIPLIRKADINLFILRSGVSKFRAATIPDRLSKEYSLNNIAIILNSFGDEKLHANIYSTNYAHGNAGTYYYSDYTGYGNYGYYDNGSRKKWWEIWK